jgi:osmotically-inducible protein OsmY
MKSDAQLFADVAEELTTDPALSAAKIAVAVHAGVVTLTGTVPTFWQKVEAEATVKRVTGVRGVANDLLVDLAAATKRDDTDIARAAADALAWHSDLPKDIQVTVSNGWVTLTGEVDWQFQRDEAKRAIKYLAGVKGVTNNLKIKAKPKAADVREKIRKELERTVDQEVNQIDIETSDGRVTLRGRVHSWAELDAARRAAWSIPGVNEVDTELVVT